MYMKKTLPLNLKQGLEKVHLDNLQKKFLRTSGYPQTQVEMGVALVLDIFKRFNSLPSLPTKTVGRYGEDLFESIITAFGWNASKSKTNRALYDFTVNGCLKVEVKTCYAGGMINQLHANQDDIFYYVQNLYSNEFCFISSPSLFAISRKQHDPKVRMLSWGVLKETFPACFYKGNKKGFSVFKRDLKSAMRAS